jgi:mannose-1-phosphate guanylyltransferase
MQKPNIVSKKNSLTIDTAMILAAGFGSRMGELTRNLPKPLLPLGHYVLLDILLKQLKNAGIRRVIINLHYLGQLIRKRVTQHINHDLEIILSEEKPILGTGGGIARAEKYFPAGDVLVLNSDVLCDISLEQFFRYHRRQNALATMAVWPSRNFRNYSLVKYSEDMKLKGFTHKGIEENVSSPVGIYTGFQILSRQARDYLKAEYSSVIESFYRPALRDGKSISIYRHKGFYIDFGTKSQYLKTLQDIKSGKLKLESLW